MSKKESGKGISRRLFLKGTALSGAVKGRLPFTGPCSREKECRGPKGKE